MTFDAILHHLMGMCLVSYLHQLQREADKAGVKLADACKKAGVASTTLQRWRNGDVAPREATAKAVLQKIKEMGSDRIHDLAPAEDAAA